MDFEAEPTSHVEYLWKENREIIYDDLGTYNHVDFFDCVLHDSESSLNLITSFVEVLIPDSHIQAFESRVDAACCSCHDRTTKGTYIPNIFEFKQGNSSKKRILQNNKRTVLFFQNLNNSLLRMYERENMKDVMKSWETARLGLNKLMSECPVYTHCQHYKLLYLLQLYITRPFRYKFSLTLPSDKLILFITFVPLSDITAKYYCEMNLDLNLNDSGDVVIDLKVDAVCGEDADAFWNELSHWIDDITNHSYLYFHCLQSMSYLEKTQAIESTALTPTPEDRSAGISIAHESHEQNLDVLGTDSTEETSNDHDNNDENQKEGTNGNFHRVMSCSDPIETYQNKPPCVVGDESYIGLKAPLRVLNRLIS